MTLWVHGNSTMNFVTTLIDEATRYLDVIITQGRSHTAIAPKVIQLIHHWNNIHSPFEAAFYRADNAYELPTAEELKHLGEELISHRSIKKTNA